MSRKTSRTKVIDEIEGEDPEGEEIDRER